MARTAYVDVDFIKTQRWLTQAERNQIPFAAAVTLTRLAQGSQIALRNGLSQVFTLRADRRIKAGIRIKPAKKGDFKRQTMNSQVNDVDNFMALHVSGGTKRPSQGRYVAVPAAGLQVKSFRTASGKVKRRFKPATMFSKMKERKTNRRTPKRGRHRAPKPFANQAGGQVFMAQRIGPSKYPLRFLWGFERSTTIKKTWRYVETVEQHVKIHAGPVFNAQLQQALATLRK